MKSSSRSMTPPRISSVPATTVKVGVSQGIFSSGSAGVVMLDSRFGSKLFASLAKAFNFLSKPDGDAIPASP